MRDPSRKIPRSRIRFQEGAPKTFWYRQQRIYALDRKAPEGLYVVTTPKSKADAQVKIRKPLVLEWGARRGDQGWVEILSKRFGGRRGPALSSHLRSKRIDAVITLRRGLPYQIILLNVPFDELGKVDYIAVQKVSASAKIERYFGNRPRTEIIDPESRARKRIISRTVRLEELEALLAGLTREVETDTSDKEVLTRRIDSLEKSITKNGKHLRDDRRILDESKRDWRKITEKFFGEEMSKEEILSFAGIDGLPSEGEYNVEISIDEGMITLEASGPYISMLSRFIGIHEDTGKVYILNDVLALTKARPNGLGARILYSQALKAIEAGVSQIECYAFRETEEEDLKHELREKDLPDKAKVGKWTGYYVWARFGYNTKLMVTSNRDPQYSRVPMEEVIGDMAHRGFFSEHINFRLIAGIPTEISVDEITLHDLMVTEKGRAWWSEFGEAWDATFDLTPQGDGEPSQSLQVLETYIREKEKSLGKSLDKWAQDRGLAALTEVHEQLDLTPGDDAILDKVWAIISRRNSRRL